MRMLVVVVGIVGTLSLGSCETARPFPLPDGKTGYVVRCNGTAVTMASCYKLAAKTCPDGRYQVVDRMTRGGVASTNGSLILPTASRELEFTCAPTTSP